MLTTKVLFGYAERENTNQQRTQGWRVNQCGYDVDKSKRATSVNAERNSVFRLIRADDDGTVYTGHVRNQVADFTDWNKPGEYYLECCGITSYPFKIADERMFNVSAPLAVKFMEMSRQDAFDVGGNTGYAWRDSHQFSFELNALAMMYMSNPSYYEAMARDVYKVDECEYEELRTQTEPNIVWLMKFGAQRYWDWCVNDGVQLHALIKGQLPYFLYLYPHIHQHVSEEFYTKIRDMTVNQWGVGTCNKAWYDVSINHSLFETQSKIGTVKGACPPGYAIVPNLMMWEVAKRDSLENAKAYFDAAYNNLEWLVNAVDLSDPANTKGQRMSEYITFHALTYAYEMYPDLCPAGTYEKILNTAKLLISRSNNMWDYCQYKTDGDLSGADSTRWVNMETSGGLCNQPGNVAGFMAIAYSLARVIKDKDICKKLRQLAVSHLDHVYGRNPHGRHFCYTATQEFDGAKLGWTERYQGGFGNLTYCVGVLDGSPKEESYPYDPDASTGYTEGWVAFNSAWNMSLAYLCGENAKITDGIGIFAN